jgi:hypothetical protein
MLIRSSFSPQILALAVGLTLCAACRREGEPLLTPPPAPTAAALPSSPLRDMLVPTMSDQDGGTANIQPSEPTPSQPTPPPDQAQIQPQPQQPQQPAPQAQGERVHVAHLLVMHANSQMRPPTVTRTVDEARTLANQLLGRIRAGEDLVALARQYSDEPGHEQKGGDLGFITRGMTVAPFDTAAFALRPGQVSAVVQTDFGFHIIRRIE